MKIVLSGYGKMGKEVEKAARGRGHQVIEYLDNPNDWVSKTSLISQADVIIDFSTPDSVLGNIRNCFDLRLPVVVGTTGWNDKKEIVKEWCFTENQAIFAASNFSIGVNILYNLTARLSAIIDHFENYNISLEETHHVHKLDAPSGTAINLAEIILGNIHRKNLWVNREQHIPDELGIVSFREDEVPGIHKITCDSETDRLVLVHEAKNRKGLAAGAILAAEWLQGRQGFFSMNDMLHLDD